MQRFQSAWCNWRLTGHGCCSSTPPCHICHCLRLLHTVSAEVATYQQVLCMTSPPVQFSVRSSSCAPSGPNQSHIMQWVLNAPLHKLMEQAAAMRDQRADNVVTFSPKVFLPVTKLCRDTCGYCTFAQPPRPGQRSFMTPDEVLQTVLDGQAAGCTEALITVGEHNPSM
jgi:tRNA A37 methylthiotransferase MiaB